MDLIDHLLDLTSPPTTAILTLQDPIFLHPHHFLSLPTTEVISIVHPRRQWALLPDPDPDHYLLQLGSLSDRLAKLELAAARSSDRKYKWTAEVKGCRGVERKYKLVAEVKGGVVGEKSFKWSSEVKGKGADGPVTKTYTFRSSPVATAAGGDVGGGKKVKKGKKEKARVVEIEDRADPGALALKQAFAKRKALGIKDVKGKKKELSPQDAAILIQITFRAHLVRRSKALRDLRELAVAKARLKEIRALFNNFSYRRRIAYDAEERQRFSEKIIVLLLTVDGIEGADIMVRAARKTIVDELEAMLDVVDPQPAGRLGSLKRRKFDLPQGPLQKEIAMGVAEVMQMLDQEDNGSSALEVSI